jgi:hypothetical protein
MQIFCFTELESSISISEYLEGNILLYWSVEIHCNFFFQYGLFFSKNYGNEQRNADRSKKKECKNKVVKK